MTRFVILFPGRTGSTHLVSCLQSHPVIVAEGERLVGRGRRWQRRWIERLYDSIAPGVEAVGFKTKLKDVRDPDGLAALLRRRDVRVIALYRRDRLRQAISTLNARRLHALTGRWNRNADSAPLPPFAPSPDEVARAIDACARRDEELSAYVSSLDLRTLVLHYEDLLERGPSALEEVQAFLGVAPAGLSSSVGKSTDDDLGRALTNYEALRQALGDGPYASLF